MDYFFGSGSTGPDPSKRKLCVRIGPNTQNLKVYNVNDDSQPQFVDSEYFTGHIAVRVKNFRGFTPDDTPPIAITPYFGTRRRLFSIQFSGRFRKEYSVDDVVFGAEFENKVNPPTGTWVALKFANLIDPALLADVYAEKPWLYSPMLCSMNTLNVQPSSTALPSVSAGHSVSELASKVQTTPSPAELLGAWTWGGEVELKEENTLMFEGIDDVAVASDDVNERRAYFRDQQTRQDTIFKPSQVYHCEIFAPFIDLNTFDLSLGININLLRYLNDQPIRLMAKSQKDNTPFFVIEFDLSQEIDS
ncbi:uncharacterized protein BJ171DRAFT_492820 [Polychytrium aggregatum]|uniref:uncharacterized protein n=1 Tax=Polychytrium aggregatum TaxID=110093 RepID=UPI0022FF1195|nr:uncharacterized protein BJ171DRAFT_492820 [Polychytrium aggregatum]KAI9207468.1 hypothetical protein BJ171DRAFT_492820 [Polychytrium aggregatum]